MSKAGPRWGIKANVRNPRPVLTDRHKIIYFDDVSGALKIVLHTMGHSCLITFVLTSILLPTILSITTAMERNVPRNFRRPPAPPTDWENGLREAVYQMLIQEGYSHPNLREHLSIAPILGQRNLATPFGDIAVLARGQLYLTNTGFAFIQDPNSYDCEECEEHQICGATHCRWSKPQNYGTLLALWTARRIRHRNRNYGHRYEIQYTISPIYSNSRGAFIWKSGLFNYNIAGHVFVTKDPVDYQALEQRGCKRCNHHENYVPATQQSYKNYREYLPPHMTVMEVKPARLKGGFLLGMNPNGGKYALQSLPKPDEAQSYHKDANAKNDLQKEIELYTRLLQSLARQRPPTESSKYITTPSPSMTKAFIPSTMPVFMTQRISSEKDMFREISPIESPSTENIKPGQKTTIPYQTTFMDFVEMPKISTVQLRPTVTTPSTQLYSKTTTVIRFPTPKTMTHSITPFRASPNYVRYSEPDPLYYPAPMIYTTARKQYFSTSQETTSSTVPIIKPKHKVYVTKANVTTTKSPTFKTTKINDVQYQSKSASETEQSQENATTEKTQTLDTTIPYEQTSVTSTSIENEQTSQSLVNKTTVLYYEATESSEQDRETTTVFNENETDHRIEQNTVLIEAVPTTTEKVLIRQETQQNLSIPHNTTKDDKTITTTIPTSSEIIQTQETLSIPHTTTMNVNDDWIQSKLTTFVTEDDNKNVNTLTTITFFNVKASEDFSTESSPPQTKVYTTLQESERHTTYLPQINLHDVESTTLKTTDTPEVETQSTAFNSEIPANTETLGTTVDGTSITKAEKEINLLDEIFGTVVTDRIVKSTTMKSPTKHKNTKEIDELFDEEILSEGVSNSEPSTKRNVRIIFSNFYLAGPTAEITTDSQESSEYTTETIKENQSFSEHTTQPVTIPTSQSYSTSISFEVNKRNKSLGAKPELNEKVKAKLTEIKLNDTEFMVFKAELPEKKSNLSDDKEMSASNTFDSIALMLVNHARSIDYINKKHNETKPKRKYRKSKHYQKKIT